MGNIKVLKEGADMDKSWVLHVENFAKIKSADIEISPLMCFVGDNNSGKSYLMSLLWGILTLGKDVFPKNVSESRTYKLCENWLSNSLGKNTLITEEAAQLYINWFNELLSNNKRSLLKRLFKSDRLLFDNNSLNQLMWKQRVSKYGTIEEIRKSR